jgi:hypothetical protein
MKPTGHPTGAPNFRESTGHPTGAPDTSLLKPPDTPPDPPDTTTHRTPTPPLEGGWGSWSGPEWTRKSHPTVCHRAHTTTGQQRRPRVDMTTNPTRDDEAR